MDIRLTPHSARATTDRPDLASRLPDVVLNPEQRFALPRERWMHQSRYFDENRGRDVLVRAVVEPHKGYIIVVTVYETTKLRKYWRENPR